MVPQQGGKKKTGGVAAASLAVAQPVVQLATAGEGYCGITCPLLAAQAALAGSGSSPRTKMGC